MYINENPKKVINYSFKTTLKVLKSLIGAETLEKAFNIEQKFPSPVEFHTNSEWLKKSKIIGVNPRIIGTYFNIVKYAMTFPEDAIHIMPVWEKGCDGGIYARVNWQLSDEWLDKELVGYGFDTPEKQLKLVVNLLHSLGKKVGFDCVPHTDKFSEEVFLVPECFEWIRLNESKTEQIKYNDSEEVYPQLKYAILNFLKEFGCADGSEYNLEEDFYWLTFAQRKQILFGYSLEQRTSRRVDLMNYVRRQGFETIPVTEHIPCRPIVFDGIKTNDFGDYADFKIENKGQAAKIFNAITPYRWYKIDNNGYPDISKPIQRTFEYFFEQVETFQNEFNFDFLRADMAHNQIAHSHSSQEKDVKFDREMWKLLKEKLQQKTPYFATFAESFLGNYYIDGYSDMINKKFDAILGISNFRYLDSDFIELLKHYQKCSECFSFAPSIVSITNDSDQKHNNKYHQSPLVNEIRYFIQMFMTLSGYTGMGFECRNLVSEKESEYSGIYTNYQAEKYTWGTNNNLFKVISKIRKIYSQIDISKLKTCILPTTAENVLMWILCDVKTNKPKYLCLVNIDASCDKKDIDYDIDEFYFNKNVIFKPVFALWKSEFFIKSLTAVSGVIQDVEFGDARIYKIVEKKSCTKKSKNSNNILLVTTECYPYAKSGGLADYCADLAKNYNKRFNADMRIILPLYNAKNAKLDGENLYIELFEKYENNTPVRYFIQDTNIETKFICEGNEVFAKLYKIKNPINDVIVYLVYSPAFEKIKKEYEDMFNTSTVFTNAVVNLLKNMSQKKEFNPNIVQVNDHLTANCILRIKELAIEDEFYRQIKTIYTTHSIFDEGENKVVERALNACDKWITVSEYMYDVLIKHQYELLGSSYFMQNKERGCGALIGINNTIYNPNNTIEFPFDAENCIEEKRQNKLFLQKEFSRENIEKCNISEKLLSKNSNAVILGSLNEDENAVLMLNLTRNDKVKGFDVVKSILADIMNDFSNTQLILVGDGIIRQNEKFWQEPQVVEFLKMGRLLVIDSFVDVKQYFAASDLLLMPSYLETCGLVLMQAMRYGTVPVANNTGCVSKVMVSIDENKQKANGFKLPQGLDLSDKLKENYKKLLYNAIDVFNNQEDLKVSMIKNSMINDSGWSCETLSQYKKIFDEVLENE